MYICICNAVNEKAIRQAVRQGAKSVRDLSAQTGCGTQCGSCVPLAREVLDDELTGSGSNRSTVDLQVVSSG